MKFEIPYVYEENYLPTKRHKNPRTRKIRATADVEVVELKEDSFPVAFVVHDYGSICEGAETWEEAKNFKTEHKIFEEEIRTFGGRLFKPLRVGYGAAISTCIEKPKKLNELLRPHIYYGNAENPKEGEVFISSTQNKEEESILEKAAEYVIFNDEVWKECGEPMYVICTFGLGHNHGGTSMFIDYHYNGNIGKDRYFTALQKDEALVYGKEIALRRGDTNYISYLEESFVKRTIDVLMPEMVRINPPKDHGDGCEFTNMMENFIEGADSAGEAGLLVTAMAMANI